MRECVVSRALLWCANIPQKTHRHPEIQYRLGVVSSESRDLQDAKAGEFPWKEHDWPVVSVWSSPSEFMLVFLGATNRY